MITLSYLKAVLLGGVMLNWLVAASWAVLSGLQLRRRAAFAANQADRLALLLESAPALPLMVKSDGRIEAPSRLADWLGLPRLPNFLSDLSGDGVGMVTDDAQALVADVTSSQKSGRSFARAFRVQGSSRTLLIRGAQAAAGLASGGAVILWVFDATESQAEIGRLGSEVASLRRSYDALSALIEAAPVPMWYRSADLRLTLVNSAYAGAVDAQDAADAVTRGLELVETTSEQSPIALAAAARAAGSPVARAVPATIAGQRRMMRIVDVPLADSGVAGYAIDIDELERAQAAFRRFVQTQRDTLDLLSAGVAQFAADQSLVFCNQPFERLFAMKREWIADRPEFDRVIERMREAGRVPEDRDFQAWKRERRGWFSSTSGPSEESWLLPGGMHLRVVAQPLPDGGLLLIFEDRTEQAQLASARDTLLRVRTATFDNLFEALGVFQADGRLHLWNKKFRETWGFEEAFLATHPRVDKLAEAAAPMLTNPSRASLIRELVRSATQERKQRSGRLALKDWRHFEFAAVPLPDGNALFTMLDITDSRKVERILRDKADALETADKIKSAFVANMSYELRTPLTSIGGFAEMLHKGFAGKLEPLAHDYVTAILDSVERLSGLVDNVLDLTQEGASVVPMDRAPVDLPTLARASAANFEARAKTKSIDFAVDIQASAGIVEVDHRRLEQVLSHLLDNALRYTPAGGRVLLHASGNARRALLVVSDNGLGMDMAEQTRALDRFSQAAALRPSSDKDGARLGLGLPLARQFVEAHGGTLTLVSEPEQGTAVSVELPR
jgi:signal transduction histidine kinase